MSIDRQNDHDKVGARKIWTNKYDYIIVGGGTAGSVLASRLSEDSTIKVLLLEDGGVENIITDFPILWHDPLSCDLRDKPHKRVYRTTSQKYACNAFPDNQCYIQIGKALGGSTTYNAMQYLRGAPQDFDAWEKQYGCDGWNYESVLPYFLRTECNLDKDIMTQRSSYHNNVGPLYVNSKHFGRNESFDIDFFRSAKELDYLVDLDLNSPPYAPKKVSYMQCTLYNGKRYSISYAMLEHQKQYLRNNLHILTHATAMKILFSKDDPKHAIGIQFRKDKIIHKVFADKEVILSAGFMESAKLLMLSGIGPKKVLAGLKIDCIADLPVGINMSHHVMAFKLIHNQDERLSEDMWTIENQYKYYVDGNGPLTEYEGFSPYALLTTKYNKQPDIAMVILGHTFSNHLLHPRSTSRIILNSTDPFDKPVLDPHYLEDPQDRLTLIEGVKESFRIAKKLISFGHKMRVNDHLNKCTPCRPTPADQLVDDRHCDEYYMCLITYYALDGHHIVGSNRMGGKDDENAVVDQRLRVRKVSGLRVIDASIMPRLTSGGTYATTLMIGEYGAQIIKDHQ